MAKIPHTGPSPLASERCAEPTQLFPIPVMGKVKRVVEIASLKAICKTAGEPKWTFSPEARDLQGSGNDHSLEGANTS